MNCMMLLVRLLMICLGTLPLAVDANAGSAEDCSQSADQSLRIKACTQFILENPRSNNLALAYTFRGAAYSASGDNVRAMADFNEALKRNPDLYEAVYERGIGYARMRDNQRMLQDTERAVQLNPSDWRGYNLRGNANKNLGNYDRAIADYGEAQRLNPKHPWPSLNRCELFIVQNKLDLALSSCNESLQLGTVPEALRLRAIVNIKMRKFDQAIEDLDAAYKTSPTSANILYARGVAKRLKGDVSAGDTDITASSQLKPADAAAMFKQFGVPGY